MRREIRIDPEYNTNARDTGYKCTCVCVCVRDAERMKSDRSGRFAGRVIMFFRDTRLCVSARAARDCIDFAVSKKQSHDFCVSRRRSERIAKSRIPRTKVQR